MKINVLVNEVAHGWEPTDARLGGTEEAVVRWAEELVKRGHDVAVYRNGKTGQELRVNRVVYRERSAYQGNGDVCLNVKSPDIVPNEPTVYFTNETNAPDLDLSKYKAVIWPSAWAAREYRVNNYNVHIVPHGYDPNRIYPERKVPKQCLYASSPDRGLQTLLRAWPQVYKAHPDATLIVTYGAPYADIPGVFFLGNLDERQMDELYRTSDVWCHPCTGVELFCISGLKAQAAGCVPVIVPAMALGETVRLGYKVNLEDYTNTLISVLGDSEARENCRKLLAQETYPTYASSAQQLEKLLLKYSKK